MEPEDVPAAFQLPGQKAPTADERTTQDVKEEEKSSLAQVEANQWIENVFVKMDLENFHANAQTNEMMETVHIIIKNESSANQEAPVDNNECIMKNDTSIDIKEEPLVSGKDCSSKQHELELSQEMLTPAVCIYEESKESSDHSDSELLEGDPEMYLHEEHIVYEDNYTEPSTSSLQPSRKKQRRDGSSYHFINPRYSGFSRGPAENAKICLRGKIIRLHCGGEPVAEISKQLGISHVTVYKWIRRFKEKEGDLSSLVTRPRSGRPRHTTTEQDDILVQFSRENPEITTAEMFRVLQPPIGVLALRRRLHEAGPVEDPKNAVREKIIDLYCAGQSGYGIAKELGISRTTACKWIRKYQQEQEGD